MRNFCLFFKISILSYLFFPIQAQETFPVNGPRNTSHTFYAFKNANIITSPGNELKNATLIIRDERIVAVGNGIEIPKNAVVFDLKGQWIYPSFIDADSDYGMPKSKSKPNPTGQPQYESKKQGAFNWNEAIHPEINASESFHTNSGAAEKLRAMGFGMVLSHEHDGIMRGSSVLVHTGNEPDNLTIIKDDVAQHFSFSKGSSTQQYPSSLMGAIALIRQSLYDAIWYESEAEKKEKNLSLEALNKHKELPVIFESTDYLTSLRIDAIAKEFDTKFIIRGSGDEYSRLNEIKSTGSEFILPLNFPLPYDAKNAYDVVDLSLKKMMEWENAPFNARRLHEVGVKFSFTSASLNEKDFMSALEKLKKTGLDKNVILSALTINPARITGLENELGMIQPNFRANFIISTGAFLEDDAVFAEHWVNGKRYVLNNAYVDIRGEYNLNVNKNGGLLLKVEGNANNPKATILKGGENIPVEISRFEKQISLRFASDKDKKMYVLLSGSINDNESRIWVGKGQLENGEWVDWAAIKQNTKAPPDTTKSDSFSIQLPRISYPLGAFGFDSIPEQKIVIFKHATVWTNEKEGILENTDVCIADGKILAVGQALSKVSLFGTKDVKVEIIEAKGKHLTSGIIDEHSHIAISRGVNEGGQAISSEVRIGDVINPDDINIYRQLSGGVTASQLLHGSANPVGGQSAIIKLRWGSSAEELKIKGADGFIKFALGENVKQSNWGDRVKIRYPQSRMGVEQVYYDAFYRAKEYGEMMKIYESGLSSNKSKKNPPIQPRRDLELEALLEILNEERFITCHSYVQSEINMLMHVADSMDFKVNTFTHILEGYKVADKMKAHGAGGSTFSDWWAYKFEVNDAIPYNAALMIEQGIVTAINSDDAEMGRRLNHEAAKVHKYGGISQEEAWKTVSLNPAKLLHLDDRMGSVKVGKDADVVLWSGNPLSVNSKVEQTYVDGKLLFDIKKDIELREKNSSERSSLVQKMLAEKGNDGKKQAVKKEKLNDYHCESIDEVYDGDL